MLVTVVNAKVHMGVSVATDDDMIQQIIEGIGAAFKAYAGRNIEDATTTQIMDGSGGRYLWLNEEARSITSIHASSEQEWTSGNLVASDKYLLDDTGLCVVRTESIWLVGVRNHRVIYPSGYAAGSVPADIQRAAYVEVARLYSAMLRDRSGDNVLEAQKIEGWSQSFLKMEGLGPETKAILDSYKGLQV
jgi:hypothetical protein